MEQLLDDHIFGKTTVVYAGFWERFLAAFIDGIIIAIPNYLATYLLASVPMVGNLIGMVIGIAYFVYFEASAKMATPGKSMLGLRVADADTNSQITTKMAVIRYFSRILSAIILMIGYFMMLFNDRKQTLHDKLAGTIVIKG